MTQEPVCSECGEPANSARMVDGVPTWLCKRCLSANREAARLEELAGHNSWSYTNRTATRARERAKDRSEMITSHESA
jgi:ribosomal protein L37AE/L43A